MRSVQLQESLAAFLEQAAAELQADVAAGQEVPFELETRTARIRSAALYCYRPLTDAFIAERFAALRTLDAYAPAVAQLARCDTLDRYLLARGVEAPRGHERCADAVLLALLQEVFDEQTAFDPGWLAQHPERLARALERLDGSALPRAGEVTLVATLHGLAIQTPEIALARGLSLAQPEALSGVPEQALRARSADRGHLLVVYTAAEARSGAEGVAEGVQVMRELLCALRLFGDGRIALGARAFARAGDGAWSTIALGGGGHPHGVLLVTTEQEDELRAFCSLTARRRPEAGAVAWALRRFELGCERACEYEALSDYLLALRALLAAPSEEATADGVLAGRLAALCATREQRAQLAARTLAAIVLEREAIAGTAVQRAGRLAVVRDLADHLRALLRDVVCGHLPADLAAMADEILLGEDAVVDGWEMGGQPDREGASLPSRQAAGERAGAAPEQLALSEQQIADEGDPGEVLRVAV